MKNIITVGRNSKVCTAVYDAITGKVVMVDSAATDVIFDQITALVQAIDAEVQAGGKSIRLVLPEALSIKLRHYGSIRKESPSSTVDETVNRMIFGWMTSAQKEAMGDLVACLFDASAAGMKFSLCQQKNLRNFPGQSGEYMRKVVDAAWAKCPMAKLVFEHAGNPDVVSDDQIAEPAF